MRWKSFQTPVRNMTPEEAADYMKSFSEDQYTLLDVRQPSEYEAGHIPGALLIPLPELPVRQEELDTKKAIIVHCAVGGRSRSAAQYLSGRGFPVVYNLSGGFSAWQGRAAIGPEEPGDALFTELEDPEAVIPMAYCMEAGLCTFYEAMAKESEEPAMRKLLLLLSGVEDRHKDRLYAIYRAGSADPEDREAFEKRAGDTLTEGGETTAEFIRRNRGALRTSRDVLNLAMMLETQALDLYLRTARKMKNAAAGEVLFDLAREETGHLTSLGGLMDKLG